MLVAAAKLMLQALILAVLFPTRSKIQGLTVSKNDGKFPWHKFIFEFVFQIAPFFQGLALRIQHVKIRDSVVIVDIKCENVIRSRREANIHVHTMARPGGAHPLSFISEGCLLLL